MEQNLLEIKNLRVHYVTDTEDVQAVNGVDLHLKKGEVLGLVGETGAGKTTVALSVMQLVPDPPGIILDGEILFKGRNLIYNSDRENQEMRGNGISMILFANIIARIPSGIILPIFNNLKSNFGGFWYWALLLIVAMLAIIVFIVFVSQAERRIPVQDAKRVVGRKVYGGQNTHLPIKVNMSGVMPIIFAQSIASLPATICAFGGWTSNWAYKHMFTSTSVIYTVIYLILIVGFSYFYATIQYNPVEVANNLKKNGGFIPGFRPGRPTADFIRKVINKVTLFGAIYLGIIAVLPVLLGTIMSNTRFSFGGTSIIIVVSVALETVAAIEAQMLMRNYSGFLEK